MLLQLGQERLRHGERREESSDLRARERVSFLRLDEAVE